MPAPYDELTLDDQKNENSGGLVNSLRTDAQAGLQTAATPPTNQVTGYTPATVAYDPTKDSVSSLVDQVIAKNSPLMQRAKTQGLQQAAQRGLLNSSLAVGAAQGAVIDRATPIATADNQALLQVRGTNASATNAARSEEAQARNAATAQERGISLQTDAESRLLAEKGDIERSLAADQRAHEVDIQQRDAAIQRGLQELRGDQAEELARLEGQFNILAKANESVGYFYAATSQAIGQILAEPEMTPQVKATLVDQQMKIARGYFNVIGSISNLDLAALFDAKPPVVYDQTPPPGWPEGLPYPLPAPYYPGDVLGNIGTL